jgi:hypothetical protein
MYLILFAPKIWQSDELLSQLSTLFVLWQNRTDLKKLTCNQAKLKILYKFTSTPTGDPNQNTEDIQIQTLLPVSQSFQILHKMLRNLSFMGHKQAKWRQLMTIGAIFL